MIPPEMIRKGDFVWLHDIAEPVLIRTSDGCVRAHVTEPCWQQVRHKPFDMGWGDWRVGLADESSYRPVSLALVHVLARNGVEVWNADTSPVQMALFEDDADLMEEWE